MNPADLVVAALVVGVVVLAVVILRRNKKKGKCHCGCDCSCCAQKDRSYLCQLGSGYSCENACGEYDREGNMDARRLYRHPQHK